MELLSGVTHEDCAAFATDFGTLLDVEDVVPGSEYTLEVSSPGLERSLKKAEEFERFAGSLVKVKTFTPVNNNRVWTGRLTGFADGVLKIDLAGSETEGQGQEGSGCGCDGDSADGCGEGEFSGGDLERAVVALRTIEMSLR